MPTSNSELRRLIEMLKPAQRRAELPRDSNGQRYFGFCGVKVCVPDDPDDSLSERLLQRLRARLEKSHDE